MPTPEHQVYRDRLASYFHEHRDDRDTCNWLRDNAVAVAQMWELDLGPAEAQLARCFSDKPRGGDPWPPITKLRSLLVSSLLGCPRINAWAKQLRSNERYRVLCGIEPPPEGSRRGVAPSVDAHYTLMHRLNDGPLRERDGLVPPSKGERNRASAVRPKQLPTVKELADQAVSSGKAARLVDTLLAQRHQTPPDDLAQRMLLVHLRVAVQPSAERGLLGDTAALLVSSDGSPLVTNANGNGHRACTCSKHIRCECPRIYKDPDACWGYDSHRDTYFFGHHLYALNVSTMGHDLPLLLQLSGGNENDQTAGPRAWDQFDRTLRAEQLQWTVKVAIQDAGHDSIDNHRFFGVLGIKPVIPLATAAPTTHPQRPKLVLSARGVPMCEAGVEMTSRGSGGSERRLFACPVKAGKLARCPKTPPEAEQSWFCQPESKSGPVVSTHLSDDPRIFCSIPRNSPAYSDYYDLRSGSERFFSALKETYNLPGCRHRRQSFWLIRSYGIAMLQHARAWVSARDVDVFVEQLLEGTALTPSSA